MPSSGGKLRRVGRVGRIAVERNGVWFAFTTKPERGFTTCGAASKGSISLPDEIGAVAGQHLLPVEAGRALRELRVVEVGDVPGAIRVHEVHARDRLHAHRILPLGEAPRAIHAQVLLEVTQLAHPGEAQRVGSVRLADHRPVRRAQQLAAHRPAQAAEQLHRQLDLALLELPPLAVEPVAVRVVGVDLEPVHVGQVGRVHGGRPAERRGSPRAARPASRGRRRPSCPSRSRCGGATSYHATGPV